MAAPNRPAPPPVIWPEQRGLPPAETRRCREHFAEIASCIKALEQSDPQAAAMASLLAWEPWPW